MRRSLRVDISYGRIQAFKLKKESLVNSLFIFWLNLIFFSPAKFDNDRQAKNWSGKVRNLKTCSMLNGVTTLSPPPKVRLHMYPIISTTSCRWPNRLSIWGKNFSKYRKLKVQGSNYPPPPPLRRLVAKSR